MIRYALIVFVMLGFVSVAVFGFTLFLFENHAAGHSRCPISVMSGTACPSENDPLVSATHHLGGLRNFSQATQSSVQAVLLALIAFLICLFFILPHPFFRLEEASIKNIFGFSLGVGLFSKLLRWISLRYKRDPAACFNF